jgi:hypothetical protein
MAFWLNVYNTMLLHSFIIFGAPKSRKQRAAIQKNVLYEVDGRRYSLNDIENGLLRSAMAHPEFIGVCKHDKRTQQPGLSDRTCGCMIDGVAINYPKNKRFREVLLPNPDFRLNFAITSGAISSPRFQIYSADSLEDSLDEATLVYLSANVEIDNDNKTV